MSGVEIVIIVAKEGAKSAPAPASEMSSEILKLCVQVLEGTREGVHPMLGIVEVEVALEVLVIISIIEEIAKVEEGATAAAAIAEAKVGKVFTVAVLVTGAMVGHVLVELLEEVVEVKVEVAKVRPSSATATARVPSRPEAIVFGPLVRVVEDFVGFRDLAELFLRVRGLVPIRVILEGQLAEGLFDGAIVGGAIHAQDFVVVLGDGEGPESPDHRPPETFTTQLHSLL